MGLLTRIAVSNGDKSRKDSAILLIAAMESHTVKNWHRQLEVEIRKKALGRPPATPLETETPRIKQPTLPVATL